MARNSKWTAVVTVAVILSGVIAFGTTVRQVNLSEMVGYADRVFYGKCLSAESKFDPDTGVTFREYRFRVKESVKGGVEGEEVIVRQIQMMGSRGSSIPGIPSYRKGQELLLFLHANSKLGLTSPVGMSQGTFKTQRLPGGEVGFINSQQNRNLTYQMESQSQSGRALTSDQLDLISSGRPVPLRMFREMVQNLDRLHEREGKVVK
jgi:hypothetical protein